MTKSGKTLGQLPSGNQAGRIVSGSSVSGRASLTATDRNSNSFTVRFELRQLKRSDDGTYEYNIQLDGKAKLSSVRLVVVGKYSDRLFAQELSYKLIEEVSAKMA